MGIRIDPLSTKYSVYADRETLTIYNNENKKVTVHNSDKKMKFISELSKLNHIQDDGKYLLAFDILCEVYENPAVETSLSPESAESLIKDIGFAIGTSATVKPETHAKIALEVIMQRYVLVEKL